MSKGLAVMRTKTRLRERRSCAANGDTSTGEKPTKVAKLTEVPESDEDSDVEVEDDCSIYASEEDDEDEEEDDDDDDDDDDDEEEDVEELDDSSEDERKYSLANNRKYIISDDDDDDDENSELSSDEEEEEEEEKDADMDSDCASSVCSSSSSSARSSSSSSSSSSISSRSDDSRRYRYPTVHDDEDEEDEEEEEEEEEEEDADDDDHEDDDNSNISSSANHSNDSSSSSSSSPHFNFNGYCRSSPSTTTTTTTTTPTVAEIIRDSCFAFVPVQTLEAAHLYAGDDGRPIMDSIHTLNEMLRQLHLAHCKSNDAIRQLKTIQRALLQDPLKNDTQTSRVRISKLLQRAVRDTDVEAWLNREGIAMILRIREQIRARQKALSIEWRQMARDNRRAPLKLRRELMWKLLNERANILPLFIGRTLRQKAPPLCGAIGADHSYTAAAGDLVAAMIKTENECNGDFDHNWILAEVIRYQAPSVYVVDDIDDDEDRERHHVMRRHVIPLPKMRANPVTHPDAIFPPGQLVLALYPQTTCFYHGVIFRSPAAHHENYLVQFEDTAYSEGVAPPMEVQQRFVINQRDLTNGKARMQFRIN